MAFLLSSCLRPLAGLLAVAAALVAVPASARAQAASILLAPQAQVTSEGVFLGDLMAPAAAAAAAPVLPHVRLADAPPFGHALALNRAQVAGLIQQALPGFLDPTNLAGADRIRLTRRARVFTQAELMEQLTAVLQRDQARDRGELELRPGRTWNPVSVPDEPFTLKVLDLPGSGLTPSFIARFELVAGSERLGPWQLPVTAKIWREVTVARSPLRREQALADADLARERRDVLTLREQPFEGAQPDLAYEVAESVPAGMPLTMRSVRLRPVVRRGQIVDAQLRDAAMVISMKVEVLDPGAPGQTVRVRNPQSRREFKGKVKDEQTILVSL
jgi:flagella basal body P-ring formation protein FlgA